MKNLMCHTTAGLIAWLVLWQLADVESVAASENVDSSTSVAILDSFDNSPDYADDSADEEGSEGRMFTDFFEHLSHDKEEARTGGGIFNTSVAFTIPLFSFTMPDRNSLTPAEYTGQAALALFGLAMVGAIAVIPYVWTLRNTEKARSESSRKESLGQTVLNMVDTYATQAGFNGKDCFLRSVCEANRDPERYGMLVLPIRFLFRPSNARTGETLSDYQHAAYIGKSTETPCQQKFQCFFSLLNTANYLVGFLRRKS